jgi:hypothetical protein
VDIGSTDVADDVSKRIEACRSLFNSCYENLPFSEINWFEDRLSHFYPWANTLDAASMGGFSLADHVRNNPEDGKMLCIQLGSLQEALKCLRNEGTEVCIAMNVKLVPSMLISAIPARNIPSTPAKEDFKNILKDLKSTSGV